MGGKTYQLVGLAPELHWETLRNAALTLRPMTDAERGAVTGKRLRIVTARQGERLENLSAELETSGPSLTPLWSTGWMLRQLWRRADPSRSPGWKRSVVETQPRLRLQLTGGLLFAMAPIKLITPNIIGGPSGWTKDPNECWARTFPLCSRLTEWCSLPGSVAKSGPRFTLRPNDSSSTTGGGSFWMSTGRGHAGSRFKNESAQFKRNLPLSENGGWSRTRIRAIALALLAAVGIYLCYRLAQPCIPSLVWAGALALVFTPLHQWIEAKVRRPNLAAAFSLVIIGLLVVAPATWFAQKLAEQATSVPENIQKQIAAGKWHMAGGRTSANGSPASLD